MPPKPLIAGCDGRSSPNSRLETEAPTNIPQFVRQDREYHLGSGKQLPRYLNAVDIHCQEAIGSGLTAEALDFQGRESARTMIAERCPY